MVEKDKDLVKQDISFLEYPLWFQDEKMAEQINEGYLWQDREGYIYRAGYKPPVKVDRLFLLYLTLKSQSAGWPEIIELSKYEILNACGISPNTHWYQRLEDSLERWKMVGVKFQGTFYDGKNYSSLNFGIIDSWNINKKTKKIQVRFSPEWLLQQKQSLFYKMIDFNEVLALRSPLTIRLYEILVKSFQNRSLWEIDVLKLAQKIPMREEYPAHIIPKIKAAVNRINEGTELQLELEIRRPRWGKAIFVFHQVSGRGEEEEPEEELRVWDVGEEQRESLEELLGLVPQEERGKKTVVETVSKALRQQDEEYIRRNILYCNKYAKKSYRGYLEKALRDDYAKEEESTEASTPSSEEAHSARKSPPDESSELTLVDLGLSPHISWNLEKLLELVPSEEREKEEVRQLIKEALLEQGHEFVIWNVFYANRHALRNYPSYLRYVFEEDAGRRYKQMALHKE
jgi:hypothetical protein